MEDEIDELKSRISRLEKDKEDLAYLNHELLRQKNELTRRIAECQVKDGTITATAYSALEYESLRDKALDMAYTLNQIENETHECAMCGGKDENGYSCEDFLKKVCYLLFQSKGYHKKEL